MANEPEATLAALRRAFDDAFLRPLELGREQGASVLVVSAGVRVAVPLTDVASVVACPTITPVPSRDPALLGLGGVRGTIVAIYDLAALVGVDVASPRAGTQRWLVLLAGDRTLGLAFDALEGRLPAPSAAPVPGPGRPSGPGAVITVADIGGASSIVFDAAAWSRGLSTEGAST